MTELEKELIYLKEDFQTELKESNKKIPENLYETYSSFSNTEGGIIYLGIKEGSRNTIIGVSNPTEIKTNLISALHSKNKVSYCSISDSDIQILDVSGKKVIRVNIRKAPLQAKPVYIDGNLSKSYVRVGDGDFLMSEDEIASLLLKKKGFAFDTIPNYLDIDETRIDQSSLKDYRERLNDTNPDNIFRNLSNHDFLLRIGALTTNNGKEVLRNGAILFFGYISDIMQLCPNYFLDYQENISGMTRWDKRIVSDDFSLNGNLYNFFVAVSKRITEDLPNPFKTDGITNLNGSDIRRSVIEALVNAITNCDFSSLPGILIKKQKHSITFTNSGDIPIGLNQAITGGISDPFNKNIMNYFRILQVSDRAGTGIPNIFQVFQSYEFATPDLRIENTPLRTTLSLDFSRLPKDTPHLTEKLKILSYLSNCPEGATIAELSLLIHMKRTMTAQILSELILTDKLTTNGKKTKGKRYFKKQ